MPGCGPSGIARLEMDVTSVNSVVTATIANRIAMEVGRRRTPAVYHDAFSPKFTHKVSLRFFQV